MDDNRTTWVRKCPACQVEILYKSKSTFQQAEKRKGRAPASCRTCRDKMTRSTMQTLEFRQKQSELVSIALEDPNNTFGSKQHRDKVAQKVRDRSPETVKFVVEKSHSPEASQKRSDSTTAAWEADPERREKQSQLFKRLMQDPSHRAKCIDPWFEASIRTGGSSKPEQRIVSLLSGFDWIHQEKFGNYRVDLTNHARKQIIEVYGSWWHCHPMHDKWINEKYDGTHPVVKKRPKEIRERDDSRQLEIERTSNYKVHVIWDFEFENLSDAQILDLLRKRGILE